MGLLGCCGFRCLFGLRFGFWFCLLGFFLTYCFDDWFMFLNDVIDCGIWVRYLFCLIGLLCLFVWVLFDLIYLLCLRAGCLIYWLGFWLIVLCIRILLCLLLLDLTLLFDASEFAYLLWFGLFVGRFTSFVLLFNFWWFVLVGRFVFECTWWVVLDLIVCIVVYCFLLVLVWWNLLFLILFWWLVLAVYAVRFICRDSCGYCLTSLVFIYGLFNSAFDFTLRLFVFTFAISFVECCVCRFAFWFLGVGYFAFVGLFLCLLF